MFKFGLFIYLFSNLTLGYSQLVDKSMLKIPDTGQDLDFTSQFGEDSDYKINEPGYSWFSTGVVYDSITTLMWQSIDGGEMTFEAAIAYCDTLTLGGFSDWRLPTPLESYSLMQFRKGVVLNSDFFNTTNTDYWWTNQTQKGDNSKIWVTNAGGGIGNHPKGETISAGGTKRFHVRAVRNSNTPIKIERYSFSQGAVIDNLTDLVWIPVPDSILRDWETALIFADTFTNYGRSDWRLPNIKELQSISDLNISSPAISNVFQIQAITDFWSSTSMPNFTNKAWYFNTKFGITTYDLKSIKKQVLLVTSSVKPLKISEKSELCLNYWPNPVTKKALYWEQQYFVDTFKILLFDIGGQLVHETHLLGQSGILDLSFLKSGLYLLKMESKKCDCNLDEQRILLLE